LYVADVKSKVTRPIRELKGFEKVFLKAGETKKVSFTLNRRSFAYWDAVSHGWVVESGKFNIEVGPSSACLPLDVEIEVKAKELPIRPITRDTTVGQIMAIPGGAEIVMQMFQNVSQTLGVGDSSESDQATQSEDQSESPFGGMDMQALLAGMPLRTLATFSGGKMDNTMLEGLIQMLNQKLLGE
jgi:beta-glucosidase